MASKKALLKFGAFTVTLFAATSCGAASSSEVTPSVKKTEDATSNKEIWGTYGSEKVVQDRARDYYASKVQDAKIDILTCKGESELDQIVISPVSKVNYFNARVTNLISSDGNVIGKNNIELFAAKYLKIANIYDIATNESKGNFPDALIPVEAIVREKTNYINAGYNQSFYVKVTTPLGQKPGVYKGNLFIQLDETEYKIAVTVDVKDYKVNAITHSKSLFLNDWQFDSGENDSSQDKLDSYNDALLDYRLSPDKLIRQEDMYGHFNSDFIFRYTEKAYEYMQNDNCTNVSIPYEPISKVVGGEWLQTINVEKFKEFLTSYYVKSIATNYNMFEKSSFYCGLIDEPDDRQILEQTKLVVGDFERAISEAAADLSVHGYISNPLHETLIEEIKNLKNIVTCAYADEYAPYIECWCPKANFYNTEEQRANYASQKEKWWYTCVYPRAPYPTYHIEDGLTSARALSWMQAEYDVVGNLFWATNVYARYNGTQYIPIEDYYQEGYRFSGVNGDGFLFYPGEPLGYNKPFGSTRLESIKDGLEEYEIFYNLKEVAKNLELKDDGMFSFLNRNLYRGTKVIGGTAEMEESRKDLIDLALANQNGSSFLITDCVYNENQGQVEMEFYANNGTKIDLNGAQISEGASYKNGHIFTAIQKLDKDENVANISVSYGGKTNTIKHNLGGKIYAISAKDLVNGFAKYDAEVAASLVESGDEELVKIDVSAINNKRQRIRYTPDFIKNVNEDTKTLIMTFKNESSKDIPLALAAKFTNKRGEQYLSQGNVLTANGYTTVTVDLSTFSMATSGNIEYLTFTFGEDTAEGSKEAVTAFLRNVVLAY
ncbi:MAG: DUF4091 domain-containing protein [Bacilli bacterium]|nr:DUF4091 domain-containing protein [Bacilli bacterium]